MSRPAEFLRKTFSNKYSNIKPRYGKEYVKERRKVLEKHPKALIELTQSLNFPMKEVGANENVMRFVTHPSPYPLNYQGLFSVPPDIQGGNGVGGYSVSNRFTGVQPNGALGTNGAYWGKPSGVAAESFFYTCLKGWDGSGPLRLPARSAPLVVEWLHGMLGYGVDSEMPTQLIFSGNCCTDIIVARSIRSIKAVNLNLGDPQVMSFLESLQPRFASLLDLLQYHTIAEGINDPDCPDFARALAHAAVLKTDAEGIWVQSARVQDAIGLEGFDPSQADNLVLVGEGRSTLSDRLVGLGVVEVRSDSNGVHASVAPLHGKGARYDDQITRALAVIGPADSTRSGDTSERS